ncbi:hypothetical protein [Okeania sp. SIO3B5]|uniref:hypothetical protein n=1 Tax=Okeania sp. SIO3B5 TaxID=2607811 RepID=UPI0025D130D8|nr:hypothetical protein [Okeania sp. SIO3B5]
MSWAGEILNNLGGKKNFTGNDGFRLNRDLKVPRGILNKSVVENFSTALGDSPSADWPCCLLLTNFSKIVSAQVKVAILYHQTNR